jgi:nicotinamidase-related amidase
MQNNFLRIKRENTAAIVIDVQDRLYPLIHEHDRLTNNLVRLISGLKALDIPIIVTQQYTKGLGETITSVKEALGEFSHIEKLSFSCCGDPEFSKALNKTGKKNVILMGIESHVCVLQTALDLIEKGYQPILIEDCLGSRNPNDKKFAIKRILNGGGIVSTYESILFELTLVSGTEQFKAISKIVK